MTGEKGKDHSDTAKENFVVNLFLMVPVYIYTEKMTARHDLEWTPVNIDCEARNMTRIEK